MRAHIATNPAAEGTGSLAREDLARQLFEQQATRKVDWEEMAQADRNAWRARADHCLLALASLGYRVERATDGDGVEAHEDCRQDDADCAAAEAERLLGMGEPLLAYNALQNALAQMPSAVRLRQLKGLALARSGALQRANDLLQALRDEGREDGETLGLLARTHKDLAIVIEDDDERSTHLDAAFDIYAAGYHESKQRHEIADAYYTGINAATMAFLRDDLDTARRLAADVEDLCSQALKVCADADCYWPQATLAEAALILGDEETARQRYALAADLAGSRYGNLSTTRRQARLLLEHRGESTAWLEDAMRVPPVVVYTGHMIDVPGRAKPRFDPQNEGVVRDEIAARLAMVGPIAVYGSAASGADMLCLECARELGSELHIVLPFPVEQFRETSVDVRDDADWGARFERLLEDADEVLVISERPPDGCNTTYEYANLIMTGLARLRAQMLDTDLRGVAVWDGTRAGDAGGTGSVVALWRDAGVPLEHVQIAAAPDAGRDEVKAASSDAIRGRVWPFTYAIESMLFADAVGYSKLGEEQVPRFFEHYAGAIAALNSMTDHKAVHAETAGDGIYMVFDDPATAGLYALELSQTINELDWHSVGLPEHLGIRVGLHCGPVFAGRDPITGGALYSGIHTNRTARIEPITPPGQVYASSAFAAVATARGVKGLRFSYIGRTQLAKDYGVLPLYHVKRDRRGRTRL